MALGGRVGEAHMQLKFVFGISNNPSIIGKLARGLQQDSAVN
jgi:hypothetical protein